MTDLQENPIKADAAAKLNPKLRAAFEYLGDKLSTHPTSRFKPPTRPVLDEWLATRRPRAKGSVILALGAYRSWATSTEWT